MRENWFFRVYTSVITFAYVRARLCVCVFVRRSVF